MFMPLWRQFAAPSRNFFRETATLKQWLLDNEERRRCPTNRSRRAVGSRSTVRVLAAVAPRFTLTKEDVLCVCLRPTDDSQIEPDTVRQPGALSHHMLFSNCKMTALTIPATTKFLQWNAVCWSFPKIKNTHNLLKLLSVKNGKRAKQLI